MEARVQRDKRFRHGFKSNAFKVYRKLDREFQASSGPTAEMITGLGNALLEALEIVYALTDIDDTDSENRCADFLVNRVVPTMMMLHADFKDNWQYVNVEGRIFRAPKEPIPSEMT
ncbi:MAG: hypothetical protein IID61_19195 [SAR324 cluster bacterium]|nr:hypothetical protein [SAR324 cluster bacterium]